MKTGQDVTGEIKDKIIGKQIVASHVSVISKCVSTFKKIKNLTIIFHL